MFPASPIAVGWQQYQLNPDPPGSVTGTSVSACSPLNEAHCTVGLSPSARSQQRSGGGSSSLEIFPQPQPSLPTEPPASFLPHPLPPPFAPGHSSCFSFSLPEHPPQQLLALTFEGYLMYVLLLVNAIWWLETGRKPREQ